jgi:DEAD/DEAH box helicase domain-containing protein
LDNDTCQKCGLKDDRLHVHHIIPRCEFDDVNDSNYKENLVTLCPSCHKTLENKSIREQLNELNLNRLDP